MSVPGPELGPCVPWLTGDELAATCNTGADIDPSVYETAAVEASLALFEISGRQFTGLCGPTTVRPCRQPCGCWPWSAGYAPLSWYSWPLGSGNWGWWDSGRSLSIGCEPMSIVKLPGYPVREIVEVKIGGEVLPEFDDDGNPNYRLDQWRDLVRMNKPATSTTPVVRRRWPGCQDMSLDDDQEHTFAVSYRNGIDPPQLGKDAAAEIACQLVTAFGGGNCVLPAGVTKVQRQGINVERGLLANWFDPTKATGLVHVDLFLRAFWKPYGTRRGSVWSPDVQQYARRVGT